ncbi:MAG: hypothetical protein H3C34_05090 [Caldilineaceae bacterium]|nr:hypothetical protein [Caldilineaceae bacterium]
MEPSGRYPSYVTCVAKALSASTQPMTIDALVAQVGERRPIGKGARRAVYRAIQQLFQAVPVAPSRIGWLSHLLNGATFRHPLTNEEARRGFLLLDELEHAVFFPQFFQNHRPDTRQLSVELFGGPVIGAETTIERKTWSLRLGKAFSDWIELQGGQGRDDILITVRDAVEGSYIVRLQPREARDEDGIRDRNILISLAAEELVTSLRRADKVIPTWELAALLVGRGMFHDPVPPDDLHMVLHKYSMLRLKDGVGYTMDSRVTANYVGQSLDDYPGEGNDEYYDVGAMAEHEQGRHWNEVDNELGSDDGAEDSCPDYEAYLEHHEVARVSGAPLTHSDYHLLEAEMETLLGLEQEFGYLLPEQQHRLADLAERLFIDPDSLRGDLDLPDRPDLDEPPYWQN